MARLYFSICLWSGVHLVCYDDSCTAEYAWYVLGAYLALILADAGWAAASLRLRPLQAAAHLDQKQVQRPLPTALSSLRHERRLSHQARRRRSAFELFLVRPCCIAA